MNKVFFYTRQQYFKFKSSQLAQGFEFISGSIFYLVENVDLLDDTQQYYVDITSIASLLKVNESQLCFFERLLSNLKIIPHLFVTKFMKMMLNTYFEMY